MKKIKLIIIACVFNLTLAKSQLIQNFEAPLSGAWYGNGSIVGNQGGSYNVHGGALMYQLESVLGYIGSSLFNTNDNIQVGVSLSSFNHYVGLWVNTPAFSSGIKVNLLDYNTYALILNLGSSNSSTPGQWNYYEYQLGSAYSGTYIIEYVANYYGNGYTYIDDIYIGSQSITSVKELESNIFKLYPNPSANGIFNIAFAIAMEDVKIEIIDFSGKIVHNETVNTFANYNKQLNTENFSKGIYIIKVSNQKSSFTQKLIVE